ncbi:MarR family transcriptional regulator [Pokkaliibacter plantistimulans]|uniref:MarR family transcriptional regulator n=1 Tax=Proteobacteria bacterium 228 TaxID=2083153 RepID=A0A2S5KVX6_9PROT|nr:MarR family transcriptional regulator [Pokkaliibacter plantistimulans]PPC78802.1 MarR family transcriptional regulator [Pokkaliibacter plantistimulans]
MSEQLTSQPDYEFTEQVGHLLRKAYQRHVAIFQQHASDRQLTAPQFVALCTVRDQGPCSITDIVKATDIDQATMRGVVDRLRAREWIALSTDPSDKRKVVIELTDSGKALLTEMIPCARVITEHTMGSLNPAERVALLYLLKKMYEQDLPAESE